MVSPDSTIPHHIAIIMDGNGRWAKQHRRPRAFGHRQGAEALKSILRPCAEMGVKYISAYAFSHENWQRSQEEVRDLMSLLNLYLSKELDKILDNNIKLHISGDISRLDPKLQTKLTHALEAAKDNDGLTLNICLSYGARQEITHAVNALLASKPAQPITEADINAHLYTSSIPEPDLLIRTGGDIRLSNFLLWQCAYTELYFTDILWPDFNEDALRAACAEFATRERRYGKR